MACHPQLMQKMVEVKQIWLMTSLRSKWQIFFKFDVDFISEKNSSKFSIKQKTLVGCSYFCNPLCSNSAHLNMANDFFFPRFSTGFQSPAGFADFHPSLWHGNTLRRWTIFCVKLEIFVKKVSFHNHLAGDIPYPADVYNCKRKIFCVSGGNTNKEPNFFHIIISPDYSALFLFFPVYRETNLSNCTRDK